MPGIVGLVANLPRERAEAQLQLMLKSMRHEHSYETGTFIDEASGLFLGWAERMDSVSAGMPHANERGNVFLVFSGEEFGDLAAVRSLKAAGHRFPDEGPAYLVHAYEEQTSFLKQVNGRFHGVLVDRNQAVVTLFNDRYGMHRVYYHHSNDGFYFAAEAKAILAVQPALRKVDNRSLGEFASCGCVLENRTLFEGIRVLPPGSAWTFRNRRLEQRASYFDPSDWENQTPLDTETYYAELRDVFARNLPRYFQGPRRIGMSLTGGLDTRMIMAWKKVIGREFPCYSFGGMFRACRDVVVARSVARACGLTHEVISVGDEFLRQFPKYAERSVYLTDGCINVSHSSDLFVNERAALIAPVRMTGNYGGEVLRRVRAFKPMKMDGSMFAQDFLPQWKTAKATYQTIINTHPLSFSVFRQAPWHHFGLLSLEETQVSVRSPFLDNDLVRTVFRAPLASYSTTDISVRLIGDGNSGLAAIPSDRGPMVRNGFSSKATREFIEFTVKAEYAFDYGMPQSLARINHALAPLHLERLFLGRHKFNHYRVWYRDQLAHYVKDMLLDPRALSRPYLSRSAISAMVQAHTKGLQNYTLEIHKALTLELFHRLFIDAR
jgi:asparagine synthase (glutamine-hydrolysing)